MASAQLTARRMVYDVTPISDPQVAPDGNQIAYVTSSTSADGSQRNEIWRCGIDGKGRRPIVTTGPRNWSPRWSPDGSRIAFFSDRDGGTGIWILSLDGGEPRRVTHHQVPLGGLCWSPDGKAIAYTGLYDPTNPDETPAREGTPAPIRVTRRPDYKQDTDARGWVGDNRSQVWIVTVPSGRRRRLTSELLDHINPAWSPDGALIGVQVMSRNHVASQLAIIDACSGDEVVRVGPDTGIVNAWAWSPDGAEIVFAGEPGRTSQDDWFLHDVATNRTTRLTDDLACLPFGDASLYAGPSQPAWIDKDTIVFHGVRAARNGIYRLDVRSGEVLLVGDEPAQTFGFSVDRAARVAVQSSNGLDHLGEIRVTDLSTGSSRLVTSQHAAFFRKTPPAQWEQFTVDRGDWQIDAWLLKPANYDPRQRYPLVIDIHGGPNWWYGYDMNHLMQVLAASGYMVLYCNPRGSTTYGRAFANEVTGRWAEEDYNDLMAVVDAAIARPDVDEDRTGVYGYSYGGYMTAWIVGHTDRFGAAVVGAGVADLVSMYGTSDITWYWGPLQFGSKPHEDPEWYRAHSPLTTLHTASTPTLVIHGEGDERVPIGQGEQIFITLCDSGCETEFVRYPGMTHLFLWGGEPSYVVDFIERVVGWFDRFLKDGAS